MNVPFTVSQGKVVVVMNAVMNTTTIAISNELSMLLLLYKQWWWDNMANFAARYCCKLSWNVYLLYWLQFPVLTFSMSGGCMTLWNWWTEVTVWTTVQYVFQVNRCIIVDSLDDLPFHWNKIMVTFHINHYHLYSWWH